MQEDEIPLIAGIDRSEELREEYLCTPVEAGIGLRLIRRPVDPPRYIRSWSKAELASRFALWRQNLKDGAVLVGGFEGQVLVAFALVAVHPEQETGEIYGLFVDLQHRGKGLGTALLAEVEHHCRVHNSFTIILNTGHGAPAVDFYLKHGFRIVGIRDPRFAAKGFDLTMAKEIREKDSVRDAETADSLYSIVSAKRCRFQK